MKTIFITIFLSVFNLTFANCVENPFAKSGLPKEMPENTRFRYSQNGGMAPSWYRIEVKGLTLSVEDKDMQQDKADMWYAEITKADKEAVYKIFYDNKFDLVKNEKREETVYDAGSEGVYIRAGKVSKNVSYGMNSPLSRRNTTRWTAAAKALKNLAEKYKSKSKSTPKNYSVISYNNQRHSFIFKKVGYRDLSLPDIDKTRTIVKNAVDSFNANRVETQRIKDLSNYKFQLVSAADLKTNDTIVWVNALCVADNSWRRSIKIVADGGNCYFNFYVNLTQGTFDKFRVNGNA